MNHFLALSALHAAAPGVLDVVFGPDGDFEDAPKWEAQLWHHPLESYRTVSARRWDPEGVMLDLSFDLRVPSVAARLAGLCAHAMGGDGDGWRMVKSTSTWALARYHSPGMAQMYPWNLSGWQGHNGVNLALTNDDSPESVLAKLTLALAPKIAALKK